MGNFLSIDGISPFASSEITKYLCDNLSYIYQNNIPIIFLCIGSDRSTGDSLGPLVGYKLNSFNKFQSNNIYIYGSLESPIHSLNIEETLNKINSNFKDPYIIAIDSCLGSVHDIGKIFIDNIPLHPGLGINKSLPPVGNISIKGIVNISGTLEFIMLQNTRLYTVMALADSIAEGIKHFIKKVSANNFYVVK